LVYSNIAKGKMKEEL